MTIYLRMAWGGEQLVDSEFLAHLLQSWIVKLFSVEWGILNQQIMFLQMKFVHLASVIVDSGSTSTYLVK